MQSIKGGEICNAVQHVSLSHFAEVCELQISVFRPSTLYSSCSQSGRLNRFQSAEVLLLWYPWLDTILRALTTAPSFVVMVVLNVI